MQKGYPPPLKCGFTYLKVELTTLNWFSKCLQYDSVLHFATRCVMCFVRVARAVISDVTVIPQDDGSLLVQWRSLLSSSLTGLVVEWSPLLQTGLFFTQFELTSRNHTLLVITGMFYSFFIAGFRIHVPSIYAYFNFLI